MLLLIIASLGFLAIHLFPALPQRATAVKALGEGAYLGLYSVISLVFISLMAFAYGQVFPDTMLWASGPVLRYLTAALMLISTILVVLGSISPNPASAGAAKILEADPAPKGIFTVTRHPLMNGIALWAALHVINNPDLPSLILFGTFLVLAVWGMVLQDRRKARDVGAPWQRYQESTSILPFAAAVQGRTRIDWAGIGWWRPAVALVLWDALLHFHADIFGVPALIV